MVQARSRVAACQQQSRTVGMDSHVGPDALAHCSVASTLGSVPRETEVTVDFLSRGMVSLPCTNHMQTEEHRKETLCNTWHELHDILNTLYTVDFPSFLKKVM